MKVGNQTNQSIQVCSVCLIVRVRKIKHIDRKQSEMCDWYQIKPVLCKFLVYVGIVLRYVCVCMCWVYDTVYVWALGVGLKVTPGSHFFWIFFFFWKLEIKPTKVYSLQCVCLIVRVHKKKYTDRKTKWNMWLIPNKTHIKEWKYDWKWVISGFHAFWPCNSR